MFNPINTGFGSVWVTKTQPGVPLNFGTRVFYIYFFCFEWGFQNGKNLPMVCQNEYTFILKSNFNFNSVFEFYFCLKLFGLFFGIETSASFKSGRGGEEIHHPSYKVPPSPPSSPSFLKLLFLQKISVFSIYLEV